MKKLYLFSCLGMVLFLAACEDLVEVDYPTNQIATTQVFEDVNTANAALAGLYGGLRQRSVIAGGSIYGSVMLGPYTDELDDYHSIADQTIVDISLNQQTETNTIIETIWDVSYTQIYYANSIIYGAENSTALSGPDKDRIKGEALLIRTLLYFYLQQMFGDIPYTTSLDYEYNRAIHKTEAAAVLEQLEVDLKEAVALLKDDYRDAERIYPNRKVAQLLLARIYLTGHKYELAGQMANEILESSIYEFEGDINEVFHKSGKHILWQLKPENSGDRTGEASFYYFTGVAPPNTFALYNIPKN